MYLKRLTIFIKIANDVSITFHEVQLFGVPETVWVQTLLAALAIICLPRQFHVAVVELRDEKHIRGARRWFAVYLILTTIAIVPIASWALHAAPQYLAIPDVAVLSLPLSYNQDWLSCWPFLEDSPPQQACYWFFIALSIMLSNDLIMPALCAWAFSQRHDKRLPWYEIHPTYLYFSVMLLASCSSTSLTILINFLCLACWPLVQWHSSPLP